MKETMLTPSEKTSSTQKESAKVWNRNEDVNTLPKRPHVHTKGGAPISRLTAGPWGRAGQPSTVLPPEEFRIISHKKKITRSNQGKKNAKKLHEDVGKY